jgi:hypothetical protein
MSQTYPIIFFPTTRMPLRCVKCNQRIWSMQTKEQEMVTDLEVDGEWRICHVKCLSDAEFDKINNITKQFNDMYPQFTPLSLLTR